MDVDGIIHCEFSIYRFSFQLEMILLPSDELAKTLHLQKTIGVVN